MKMSPATSSSSNNDNNNINDLTTSSEVSDMAAESAAAGVGTATTTAATEKTLKFMNYHRVLALLALLLCGGSFIASVDGLKCHMCGQYNEGVGSITPCLNYSDQYAHLYLKDCPKRSEKFCVKYVSELSTVRDCATECVEKEIWETQTYCCDHDGCNGSSQVQASVLPLLLLPLLYNACNTLLRVLGVRR